MVSRVMRGGILKTILITASLLLLFSPSAMATCGWTGDHTCYTGSDTHGATPGNSGPRYDESDVSYKYLYIYSGDQCQGGNMCCAEEWTIEWKSDANSPCCGKENDYCCGRGPECCEDNAIRNCNAGHCPGKQTCSGHIWGLCEKIDSNCPACCGEGCDGK